MYNSMAADLPVIIKNLFLCDHSDRHYTGCAEPFVPCSNQAILQVLIVGPRADTTRHVHHKCVLQSENNMENITSEIMF